MKISRNILNRLPVERCFEARKYVYYLDEHGRVFRSEKDLYKTGLEKWVYCGVLRRTVCGLVLVNEEEIK